jgi:hypothetical protein
MTNLATLIRAGLAGGWNQLQLLTSPTFLFAALKRLKIVINSVLLLNRICIFNGAKKMTSEKNWNSISEKMKRDGQNLDSNRTKLRDTRGGARKFCSKHEGLHDLCSKREGRRKFCSEHEGRASFVRNMRGCASFVQKMRGVRVLFETWGPVRLLFETWRAVRVLFETWGPVRLLFETWRAVRVLFEIWGAVRLFETSWIQNPPIRVKPNFGA